ncbi:MAG: AGE family epimerase/isomerase, partial [Dehalococcoidia bacterium]
QDADEEFYRLPAAEREKRQQPYVDRICYTGWNAMAASAYLEASWTLGRPELRERAVKALAFVWDRCREPHKGMYHFNDGTPQVPGLLADQAYTARALLDAYEVVADPLYLKRAQELAAFVAERFVDEEDGGFFDVWDEQERLGRLEERQKSIQENAVCAEVFVRLQVLTRKKFYQKVSQAALEAFASNYQVWGYQAASYGKVVDMFQSGLAQVYVVGDPGAKATCDLQLAALAVDVPAIAVQVFDPKRDGNRLDALMLPKEFASVAYVYVGAVCSAPLANPEAIEETVRDMQSFAQALS